jgi:hypothetical protein
VKIRVLQQVTHKRVTNILTELEYENYAVSLAMTSNPNPTVGEECWKTDLDTTVEEGTRSLDCVEGISLPEVVVTMWKVHRL